MTIKLGIQGASGRAGSLVLKALVENKAVFELGAAIVASSCPRRGEKIPLELQSGSCEEYTADLLGSVASVGAWIDFSSPEGTVSLCHALRSHPRPLLVATTGHSGEQREVIEEYSKRAPVLIAPNTSIGVFVLREAVSQVSILLGDDFDREIVETHHRMKRDAPSGTAKMLLEALSEGGKCAREPVYDRSPGGERGKREVGIASLRGGDVVGEHTVFFYGTGERIELTHRATDRSIFARGALRLLEKLIGRKPGLYELSLDLFTSE